jgi:hypothetical protein
MRLIGTGVDPLNRYAKGVAYDLPDDDEESIDEHLARGWGRIPNQGESPPTAIQLAQAIVRGDSFLLPEEAEAADQLRDRAHAVAHIGDPKAVREAAAPPVAGGRPDWSKIESDKPKGKRKRLS